MATRPKKHKVRLYGIQPQQKEQRYIRTRSAAEYHTSRWTRESKTFRTSHPLCAECEKKGILTPAEVVDHVIPYPVCGDFWNRDNWQALCSNCNVAKGNRDKKLIAEYKQKNNQDESKNS